MTPQEGPKTAPNRPKIDFKKTSILRAVLGRNGGGFVPLTAPPFGHPKSAQDDTKKESKSKTIFKSDKKLPKSV